MAEQDAGQADYRNFYQISANRAETWSDKTAPDAGTRVAQAQQDDKAQEGADGKAVDLGKASQEFANPLTSATLFIVENDTIILDGDISDDTRVTNVTVIEPIIPLPLGDSGWTLVNRPILPIGIGADIPIAGESGTAGGSSSVTFDNESGLGDFTFFSLLSPPNDGNGLLWGVGPTLRFPTATDDQLGSEKWSVGPAAVALYSSKELTLGVLNQNFFSYAGDGDRDQVRQSTIQYFAFYNFHPQWGIGTAPIVSIDWDESDNDDRYLVPVGIGLTHTFKLFDVPMRLLLEGQHYVVQRETFGPEWNFRVALGMFLPPLF